MKYLKNCFLLLTPILLWNIFFYDRLPNEYQSDTFWDEIPSYISLPENILRYVVFILPATMFLEMRSKIQKAGLQLYIYGLGIYFLSWILQMKFPESSWSNSYIGFTAPAFTSIFFVIPIGLIGKNNLFGFLKLNWLYLVAGLLFVLFHTWHAALVYQRIAG